MDIENKSEKAFKLIIAILQEHNMPFQVTGGLAAKEYGSTRPLKDIDIDIPDDAFDKILDDVKEYIVEGPWRHVDKKWDCILLMLNYHGQDIDISGAKQMKIFNEETQKWEDWPTDLASAVPMQIFDTEVPVVRKEELIAYKRLLIGKEYPHQQGDIDAIRDAKTN